MYFLMIPPQQLIGGHLYDCLYAQWLIFFGTYEHVNRLQTSQFQLNLKI
jgi:hypothetical protein